MFAATPIERDDRLVFPAEFFDTYSPINARDMVDQVPGFQIDNGSSQRGFGGTSGNVLINGNRVSSKTDRVSSLLERIPADRVRRIELIQENLGRYDSSGQEQLVNVVIDADQRSWTWEAKVEQDLDSGGPTPTFALSMLDRTAATEWRLGIDLSTSYVGNEADERLLDASRPLENRDEFERFRTHSARFNANSVTELPDSRLNMNLELRYTDRDFRENSRRTASLADATAFNLDRRSDTDEARVEFGADFEWSPAPRLSANVIALLRREQTDDLDQSLRGPRRNDVFVEQQSDRYSESAETIGRFELDWSGLEQHLIEFDFEAALNRLDNQLTLQTVGDEGQLIEIAVPGANNRVEEVRSEITLRDNWTRGALSMESSIGLEISELSQARATTPDRQFKFFKPSLRLTYAPDAMQVSRVEVRREIAQLNFSDFVSAANFSDADIDRGNPNLEPQKDWLVQLSREQRFNAIGSIRLALFHRWVRDVKDRLPIDDQFEVPGNIGDGRRWGATLEGTLPLESLKLRNARLDFETRWERSQVTDPVTGSERRFSGQRRYEIEAALRQDIPVTNLAWGMEAEYEDRRVQFELDEIDASESGVELEAFLESTRWLGVKTRLTFMNLLNRQFKRDRRVFELNRDNGQLLFRELRDRRRGRSVLLSVSGSF